MIGQLQRLHPIVIHYLTVKVKDAKGGSALICVIDAKGFFSDSDVEWDDVAFAIERGDYGDEGKMWAVV